VKTQNELILENLIQLGYVMHHESQEPVQSFYKIMSERNFFFPSNHDKDYDIFMNDSDWFLMLLNALVSECGKRGCMIVIADNTLVIKEMGQIEYSGDYTRENIAQAFCKVTGIEI